MASHLGTMTSTFGTRSSSIRFPLVVLLFTLFLLPSFSHADAPDDAAVAARQRYSDGTKAMREKRYREAALHFEAATRMRPHSVAAFATATAWEKAGEPIRAADYLARAIELGALPPDENKRAQQRLESLEKSMGTIVISGPGSLLVQLQGLTQARPPTRLHGPEGIVTLVVDRNSLIERRDVRLKTGQVLEVDVTQPKLPKKAEPPVRPTPLEPVTSQAPPPPPPPPQPPVHVGPSTQQLVGYSLVGAGVVAAGVSATLGVKTLSARKDYESLPNRDRYDTATSLKTWTNVSFAGAVVFGGAGIALLLWPNHPAEHAARVTIMPTSAGLELGGAF